MGYCTWWLTTVLCFLAIAASQESKTTRSPEIIPYNDMETKEPHITLFDDMETKEPPITLFDESKTTRSPEIILDNDMETKEPHITLFDDMETKEPHITLFDNQKPTEPPMITLFDGEEMKGIDDMDVMQNDENDMKLLARDFMETNPTEVNGQPLFETDMLLTQSQRRALRERKGLVDLSTRWPLGTDGYPLVPYVFLDSDYESIIREAMQHWMNHTCIKFQETTNTDQSHLQYIKASGCWSYVGMLNQNGQQVSIGNGCQYLGTAVHEIGHATGFMHEQSRSDRDDYVAILYENIADDREGNFAKYLESGVSSQGIEYDYSSNMHYGPTGFTINGKTTIATKDPLAQGLIGQRNGLSHRDKQLANIMYNCIEKWKENCGESSDPCQNDGYYGAACACVCPPGTSGTNCETITGDYYDSLRSSCTEKITEEGTITSPDYPSPFPIKTKCVKWIQAPECYSPRLTFSDFYLYGRDSYCDGNACCYYHTLEMRLDSRTNGEVYCSTDIISGQVFEADDEIILFFRSLYNTDFIGWSANLTFVREDGCEVTTKTTTTETTTTTTTTTEPPTTTTTTTEPPTTTTTTTTEPPTTTTTTTEPPTTTTTTTEPPTTTTTTTEPPTTTTTTTTEPPTTTTTTTEPPTATTTTTEPSTTTTTETTTTEPPPTCLLQKYNGVYYWSSPYFGNHNYPNNARCSIHGRSGIYTAMAKIVLQTFHLQNRRRRSCRDKVTISHLYGQSRTFCGKQVGKVIRLPTFNFDITFSSNRAITRPGFNISITPSTTPCHKTFEADEGVTNTITSPSNEKFCEYRIVTKPGWEVQIDYVQSRVRRTRKCRRDYILINGNSDRRYPMESSKILCGMRTHESPITSTTGQIFVAYKGMHPLSKGFDLQYTTVPSGAK